MAQFDVYRRADGPGYLLDCQSDLLSELSHRLAVPLLPIDFAPASSKRLNPDFWIDGECFRMMTQYSSAVPAQELKNPVATLDAQYDAIIAAIDVLLRGF